MRSLALSILLRCLLDLQTVPYASLKKLVDGQEERIRLGDCRKCSDRHTKEAQYVLFIYSQGHYVLLLIRITWFLRSLFR